MAISRDLSNLGIEEHILQQATATLNSFPIVSRPGESRKRKQLILLALYETYKENNTPVCCNKLGVMLGLTQKEIKEAFSKFYGRVTQGIGYVNPILMIPEQADLIGCDKNLTREITQYSEQLLQRKPRLFDAKRPQLTAAALIMYFLHMRQFIVELNITSAQLIADKVSKLNICPNNLLAFTRVIRDADNLS